MSAPRPPFTTLKNNIDELNRQYNNRSLREALSDQQGDIYKQIDRDLAGELQDSESWNPDAKTQFETERNKAKTRFEMENKTKWSRARGWAKRRIKKHRGKIIAVAALAMVGAGFGIAHSQGAFSQEIGLSGAKRSKENKDF